MFYLTASQATEMLSRTGFLSEGESISDQFGGEAPVRVTYADRYGPQAVSRSLADAVKDSTFVVALLTSTGMHPEAEDLNLYYGFRRSFQDHRSLLEAPAHLFETEDHFHLRSFLFMTVAFRWDAVLFSSEERAPIELGRDQSLRFHHPQSAIAKKFEAALSPAQAGGRVH